MIRILSLLLIMLASPSAVAGLLSVFRAEDGHTNWQYVANTSGTLLLLALSYTLLRLFLINREARRYNQELVDIRSRLEERVRERTATLDASNQLLQESHTVLEGEITEHRTTSNRLRQSESYIQSILRSMPLILIGLDQDGIVTQWNWRAEEVSGLQKADALGRKLWTAYPSVTVTPQQIDAVIRDRRTLTVKQSQRGRFHYEVTIYPLSQQSEPGVVVLIDDVTQRVMAETMLIQRDKMSSMGELAGSLAQDISTPVNAMLMGIREVQSRVSALEYMPDQNPLPMLEDVLVRGEQVSAVISNLLEFSRGNTAEMKPADITEIINHSLELATAVLTELQGLNFLDVQIEKMYEANLPRIPCHATELQQVFLSLFRYCHQALGAVNRPDHHPIITIQANKFYDALWIKVQHNGRGISLQEQQVLFEAFFTESDKADDQGRAAAQRLSYPYFIVTEQHRGEMAVTSDINVGTTFHIQLLLN